MTRVFNLKDYDTTDGLADQLLKSLNSTNLEKSQELLLL